MDISVFIYFLSIHVIMTVLLVTEYNRNTKLKKQNIELESMAVDFMKYDEKSTNETKEWFIKYILHKNKFGSRTQYLYLLDVFNSNYERIESLTQRQFDILIESERIYSKDKNPFSRYETGD
jgi:hypothetical protein